MKRALLVLLWSCVALPLSAQSTPKQPAKSPASAAAGPGAASPAADPAAERAPKASQDAAADPTPAGDGSAASTPAAEATAAGDAAGEAKAGSEDAGTQGAGAAVGEGAAGQEAGDEAADDDAASDDTADGDTADGDTADGDTADEETADEEAADEDTADEEAADDEAADDEAASEYAHHGGIELPGQLQLHGMFDLAYERLGYTDNPADGDNALRNYHHFIFLRREVPGDPLSIDVELVDLTFYEIGLQLTKPRSPVRVDLEFGKVLVPFGDEPLFHHTYGGLGGFDQTFVPAVWARHGLVARARGRFGDLGIRNAAYVVQGHAIDADDAVIDLQRDLAPADDAKLAVGDRVGFSWDAISVWYSVYYSRLGFDRQLLLQAIDVGIHRLRDVPVLEDLEIAFGVVRADVSGGTWTEERVPLEHYYHFADYLQLRYHVLPWLRLDARTGIVTTNNRDGVVSDDSRADITDVDTHNLGVTVRYRALSAGLHHVWRMEARDERDDDFLRLRVSYAF